MEYNDRVYMGRKRSHFGVYGKQGGEGANRPCWLDTLKGQNNLKISILRHLTGLQQTVLEFGVCAQPIN